MADSVYVRLYGYRPKSVSVGCVLRCSLALAIVASRSGIVVARLPVAREGPGSNRAADKRSCFHENHCDTQLWARAAH